MGFAKAAAAILSGVAPRVQQTYTNAANADAGYAHGLGSNVQQTIDQQAATQNDFLTKMGTPTAGLEHPADVGGTAYGLEGYIPATTLQREGAAFGSAAQMLPGDVLRQGQQQASATIANDPNLASLQGALAKIAATQPEVYQRLLSTLSDMGYKKAELGLRAQSLQSENQYRQAELGMSQQRLNLSANQSNRSYRLSLARLGLEKKSLQLRAQSQEARLHGGHGGKPAFTPDELVHIKATAGRIAQATHDGVRLSNGQPDPTHPPLKFKQAFKQEILAGIPPSVAIGALREAGYKIPQAASDSVNLPNFGKALFGMPKRNAGVLMQQLRKYPNLDPQAVLAIASMEGLGGGMGDNGTSFGPFQLHMNGALPPRIAARGARYAQAWAWSPAGLNYALKRINAIAGGLRGEAAIAAISRRFERPANPNKEIRGASRSYGRY
jgi:hypothetical protein